MCHIKGAEKLSISDKAKKKVDSTCWVYSMLFAVKYSDLLTGNAVSLVVGLGGAAYLQCLSQTEHLWWEAWFEFE